MEGYKERRRRQGQHTEECILQAALTLMRERGFDQVSVRDICTHAGITTGAFYHHFRSKDELLERGFAPLDQYMERQISGHENDPFPQRLSRILDTYVAFMEGIGPALVGRYYQQRLANPSIRSMDATRYTLRAILSCFQEAQAQGALSDACTPEWATQFCFCHFRGIVIDWVLSGHRVPLSERVSGEWQAMERVFLK